MITQEDIQSLVNAASIAGYKVNIDDLKLVIWEAGVNSHIPLPLPAGFSAVYIFKYGEEYLKVGQAGIKSSNRYQSHHYYTTAPSTLAKSLLKDKNYLLLIANKPPKNWIVENTTRYNILIPTNYSKHFVNYAEAFFILRCNPLFEKLY